MMQAFEYTDPDSTCGFKRMKVGKGQWYVNMDTATMILLRRLAFPNRLGDLTDEFNMPSHRICEAFHGIADVLFERFANKLSELNRWSDLFPVFSATFQSVGCPFRGMIGIIDGNFLQICRPFGKDNWISTLEQQEFYSGKEKAHGIKFLAAVLANGIVCIFGPSFGRRHDSFLMQSSGWLRDLHQLETRTGPWYHLFGDSAFGLSRYLQVMRKGFLSSRSRTFNAVMSRVRILVENMFAGTSNIFNFLSYHGGLTIGGRDIHKIYMVANFLMNVRTCYFGNQMTAATGIFPPTVDDLLARVR